MSCENYEINFNFYASISLKYDESNSTQQTLICWFTFELIWGNVNYIIKQLKTSLLSTYTADKIEFIFSLPFPSQLLNNLNYIIGNEYNWSFQSDIHTL